MLYFKSPTHENIKFLPSIFMAGSISNSKDWQEELAELLNIEKEFWLINPRRDDFDISKKEMSEEQIDWEFKYLNESDAVLFWFAEETLAPITLYELGKLSMSKKPLFIGCHPNYQRKFDVEYQTKLIRPEIKVVDNLKDLSIQIIKWIKNQ